MIWCYRLWLVGGAKSRQILRFTVPCPGRVRNAVDDCFASFVDAGDFGCAVVS